MLIDQTEIFSDWLRGINDRRAKAMILNHIDRMEDGNFGIAAAVGAGIFEKKIDYGPGYRLYYCQIEKSWVLLLCGGDKSTQQPNIDQAKEIMREIKWAKQ